MATLQTLDPENNAGYGRLPIPSNRDIEVMALLGSAIGSSSLSQFGGQLRREHHMVLRAFAERMASLGVRTKDAGKLKVGLVALGLAGLEDGCREALLLLPLFYHAAGLLGMHPRALFVSAQALLQRPSALQLEQFLARRDEDKSLESMGYRIGSDDDGFRYERMW